MQDPLQNFVVVREPDGQLKDIAQLKLPDGRPASYDGHARHAVFEAVFGRRGSDQEIINQTFQMSAREIVVPHGQPL